MNELKDLYSAHAEWWPLLSPVEEYAEEAAYSATVLRTASRPVQSVLELGSGGGHNAYFLKNDFTMTLVDLSEDMLRLSQRLNPECQHICGDMRTLRLTADYDAVFVHDAVDYMTDEQSLSALVETAFLHCRPGGLALLLPDHTRETFTPSTEHGGTDGPDGRGIRYLEWSWDPDPNDSWIAAEYALLLRHPDGSVTSSHETHRIGVFSEETWLRLMASQGFRAEVLTEETTDPRVPRRVFVGRRE